ncbi:hypothetical protein NDU88_008079 [Pleurodeles waltl]|uniref:Uncharacterized protein n=1 Tax=Pleurodeles waltl TaxID=8319 RepID=A0AAV7N850_PLEWA|nr:hypothetical protein NDU88_008079 [Pleurodeles waltl]
MRAPRARVFLSHTRRSVDNQQHGDPAPSLRLLRGLPDSRCRETEEIEEKLKQTNTLEEAKKKLEEVSIEFESFDQYQVKRKTEKLKKDIRYFTVERTYPYVSEGYYKQLPSVRSSRMRTRSKQFNMFCVLTFYVAFSERV